MPALQRARRRLATSPASRTRAVRDGDECVVNGQKIWTSMGHLAKFGILIARTDPDAPKHQGISYFICPMDAPGIEVRPIIEMTGAHMFNEVFFTDVRIPAENLVGEVNEGWTLAKVTLGNERVSLSSGGVLWGMGPTAFDLLDQVRAKGRLRRPDAAPAPRRAAHRGDAARPHPAAHGVGPHQGRPARARGVDPQDPRRRARPADDGPGQGPRRRRRPARRRRRCGTTASSSHPALDGRRRHRRGAAQHRRRAGARPARTTRLN